MMWLIGLILVFLVMMVLGIMNSLDELAVIGGVFFVCLTLLAPVIIDSVNYSPYRAEMANNYCISKGFETYDTYSSKFMTKEALGIKCAYVIINKRDVSVNQESKDTIIVV